MPTAPMLLVNPSQRVRMIEDWIANAASGTLNWTTQNAGTGAAPTLDDTLVDANHAGILKLTTGTTAAGRSGLGLSLSASVYSLIASGGTGYQEWLIQLSALSNGTDTFTFGVGFGDIFTAEFTNGSYFFYDTSIGTNWLAKTASSSSRTVVDTGVTVAANQWIKLRIDHNAGANRIFSINGTQVATITTNITTTDIAPAANIHKSVGTTAILAHVDYFILDHVFTTTR